MTFRDATSPFDLLYFTLLENDWPRSLLGWKLCANALQALAQSMKRSGWCDVWIEGERAVDVGKQGTPASR
jgi:hypothetical protein